MHCLRRGELSRSLRQTVFTILFASLWICPSPPTPTTSSYTSSGHFRHYLRRGKKGWGREGGNSRILLSTLSLSLLGAFSLFRDRKSSLLSASFLLLLPICKVVVGVVVVAGVPCVLCTVVCRWIYSPLPPPAHRRRAARLFPLSPLRPSLSFCPPLACTHRPTPASV